MANLRLEDMTGKVIGKWNVIRKAGNSKRGAALWECVCSCGEIGVVTGADLRNLKSKQCRKCAILSRTKENDGLQKKTHGMSNTRIYNIWMLMRGRCNNKNNPDYGGRGISVCEEWNDFVNFHQWALSSGYEDHLTIDRKDFNGNYNPENCRWLSAEEQSANRRNVHLAPDGEPWWHKARRNGVTRAAYEWRKAKGWDWLKIVETPLNQRTVPYIRDDVGKFTK